MYGSASALSVAPRVSVEEREIDDLRSLALGRMTSHFGHEMRNVLTGMRCYLELLSTANLPSELSGFMTEVQGGLDRMADLTALWHDVARGRCATAHINSEVSRLVLMLHSAGVGKQILLEVNLDPVCREVRADATALEAILLALLDDLIARRAASIRIVTTALPGRVRVRLEASAPMDEGVSTTDLGRLNRLLGETISVVTDRPAGYELLLEVDANSGARSASAVA